MLLKEIFQDNMKRYKVTNPDGSTLSLTFISLPSIDIPMDDFFEEVQRVAYRPTDLSFCLDKAIWEAGGVSAVRWSLQDITHLSSFLKFRDQDMAKIRSESDSAIEEAYRARVALIVL